ncbi:transcriptional regulator, partial [Bacillus subtilis]|nr:transcriptional regulator [Bacillus subtilis]
MRRKKRMEQQLTFYSYPSCTS